MRRWIDLILADWPLKLGALGLATALYVGVSLAQNDRTWPGQVPIEVLGPPPGGAVLDLPGTVTGIRYRAPLDVAVTLANGSFLASIDLADVVPTAGGDPVPVPVKRGGALFMHRLTQHASLKNVSDGIRWSFDLRYQPTGKPTGRPAFPHFIARSRAHPETELRDWRDWAGLWADTRERLAERELAPFNRWKEGSEVCA